MSGKYDDIIRISCPPLVKRMSVRDRAAQFAPFAALTGYDEAGKEMARVTEKRIELDEGEIAILNEKLCRIAEVIDQQPMVAVTYFQPDKRKAGGAYVTISGRVKQVDPHKHQVVLVDGKHIFFDQMMDIQVDKRV